MAGERKDRPRFNVGRKVNHMHSRAVLFISVFVLAGLLIVGSVAIHLTAASASPNSPMPPGTMDSRTESASGETSGNASLASSGRSIAVDSPRTDVIGANDEERQLSARERSTADSLEVLLRQVHSMFEPEGADVSNAMIPFLAEMIMVVNQSDRLLYSIEIVEPDAALARRRAETLNDVFRLNVLQPSKLRIFGRQGRHGALVEVALP